MFGKILVALKFSPSGLNAIDLAVRLSQAHGARLHVFHALDYHFKNMDDADPKMNEILTIVRQRIEVDLTPRLAGPARWPSTISGRPRIRDLPHRRQHRRRSDCGRVSPNASPIQLGPRGLHRYDYFGKAPCAVLLVPLIESFGSAAGPDQPG